MRDMRMHVPAVALCACAYAGALLLAPLAIVSITLGAQAIHPAHVLVAICGALLIAVALRSFLLRFHPPAAGDSRS